MVDRQEPRQLKELKWRLQDLIDEKKETYKTRQKTRRKVICIDFDCWIYQSVVTYVYIGNMTYPFESDTRKYFLNKLNLKS
jgi:hypothetical protein